MNFWYAVNIYSFEMHSFMHRYSRGWKLNNLTSVGHYVLGVSCNYSLFFVKFLLVIHYS